jgi:hypothetical protein
MMRRLTVLLTMLALAGALAAPAFAWHLWDGTAQSACNGHPASYQPLNNGWTCGAVFPALYAPEVPSILVWPAAMLVALAGYVALERRRRARQLV